MRLFLMLILLALPAFGQDADRVQAALDAGGTWRPTGTYLLERAVHIRRPITIQGPATFKAAKEVAGARYAMILAGYISNVTVRDITIDGSRDERAGAWFCDGTVNAYFGSNIHFDHVEDLTIERVTTRNAVCGSGMHVTATRARITGSRFIGNGLPRHMHWADGLTLLQCDQCVVTDNTFIDNTDIGFVFGGGRQTLVARNTIRQSVPAFAGLALDNFNGSRSGDFTGTVVTGNLVDCGVWCNFGINIGPYAWYRSQPIFGGRVSGNQVFGGKIGILVGGAGVEGAPISVYGNDLVRLIGDGSPAPFSCGFRTAYAFLVAPESVVLTPGESPSIGRHELCP